MLETKRPEALDTRHVLAFYAVIAGAVGVMVFCWGNTWWGSHLGDQLYGKAVLLRISGAVITAAACCAMALRQIDDPSVRMRTWPWFVAAHVIVWLVVTVQRRAIGIDSPLMTVADWMLLSTAFLLLFIWVTADGDAEVVPGESLGSISAGLRTPRHSAAQLRARYEHEIREAGALEERNRLARDLHDAIKQQIFVVHTAAATAQERLVSDPEGARQALAQVRGASREAMTEMEAMLENLRATPLENSGLVEALKRQCEALEFRTGARVAFRVGDLPPSTVMPPGSHQAIFRIAQEALNNVARHARAGKVAVSFGHKDERLTLTISDDGVGLPAEHRDGVRGMGLSNMRARADELGATLEVTSYERRGTSVTLSLRAGAPSAFYKRRSLKRAAMFGGVMLIFLSELVRSQEPYRVFMVVMFSFGFARHALAYIRLSRERQVVK